jgi:hypothetical protein
MNWQITQHESSTKGEPSLSPKDLPFPPVMNLTPLQWARRQVDELLATVEELRAILSSADAKNLPGLPLCVLVSDVTEAENILRRHKVFARRTLKDQRRRARKQPPPTKPFDPSSN